MANPDNPFGLRPVRHKNGAPFNGSGTIYHVASGDSQVIAPGDPVIVTGTADAYGVPTVTRATAGTGNRITGVMLGMAQTINPVLSGTGSFTFDHTMNTTASTSQYIVVADDPDLVFHCQCDGAVAVTDISANAVLVIGTASEGKSAAEVDNTSFATTAGHQVKVLRAAPIEGNEIGTNTILEVMINQHTQSSETAGI